MIGVLVVAMLLVPPLPVAAGSTACSVSPDPVTVGTPFSVSYSGLKGNIWYWLRAAQGTEHFGHHPDLQFITDPSGSGVIRVPEDWPNAWTDPREALEPGSVKVRFYSASLNDTGDPAHTGKGPSANCQFMVS